MTNGACKARRARPPLALAASLLAHGAFAALVGTGVIAFGQAKTEPQPVPAVEVDLFDGVAAPPEAPAPPAAGEPVTPRRAAPRAPLPSNAKVAPSRSLETPNPALTPAAPLVEDAPVAGPVRFAMSAGTVAGRGVPASRSAKDDGAAGPSIAGAGQGARDGEGDIVGEDRVTAPARLLTSANVPYPPSARQAEIEADVQVELVVGLDGRVSDARVVTRGGYGLDEAALQGVRSFRFSPALCDGHPVRVRMRWPVQFRLR